MILTHANQLVLRRKNRRRLWLAGALLTLLSGLIPAQATQIVSGQSVAVSGAAGSSRHYRITVPAGSTNLTVRTFGGTGDCDLYIRQGAQASTILHTRASEGATTAETISVASPATGDWYILVYGYTSYSGATLQATITAGSSVTPLSSGQTAVLSGAGSSSTHYRISVPAGATNLTVRTFGGTGDPDLYVRQGAQPTTSTYSARSIGATSTETVSINSPAAADWYILVYGYSSFSGVSLQATVSTNPTVTALTNGQIVTRSGALASQTHYRIAVPSGASNLTVRTYGGSGNPSLYVRLGAQASTSSYTGRSIAAGTAESVSITSPASGDWYILVYGTASYSNISLQATYTVPAPPPPPPPPSSATTLTLGARTSGNLSVNGSGNLSVAGTTALFRVPTTALPAGMTELVILCGGTGGDMDLYVGNTGTAPGSTSAAGYIQLTGATSHHSYVLPASQVTAYGSGGIAVAVHADEPGDYTVLALARASSVTRRYIRNYIYTVGTGLSDSIENTHPTGRNNLNALLTEVTRVYEAANPNMTPAFEIRQWRGGGADPYRDLNFDTEHSGLDSYTGTFPSNGNRPNGPHTFLVENLQGSLGVSYVSRNGQPGSFGAANVVMMGAGSFDSVACVDAQYVVPVAVAHENGHYMGLEHTSELGSGARADGSYDPISDTLQCPAGTYFSSCPDYYYLLFPLIIDPGTCPAPALGSRQDDVSAGQGAVVRGSAVSR